ncbi:hypothetical protein ATANTOWER_006925 [Ataeniobius toweri]|uniref:Secreted protein n=1 Tax=Ataeniobius toweri TaxID=208326 RepID=A0ABU7AN68_9TELE|nr:hypothetical protein [Ataeniobius toweri]
MSIYKYKNKAGGCSALILCTVIGSSLGSVRGGCSGKSRCTTIQNVCSDHLEIRNRAVQLIEFGFCSKQLLKHYDQQQQQKKYFATFHFPYNFCHVENTFGKIL